MRWGWSHREEFGWFMSAASAALGLALVCLVTAHLLIWRYEAKVAESNTNAVTPASLTVGTSVLGADIGDVPSGAGVAALLGALKTAAKDLPWHRALLRRNPNSDFIAIESVFIPVDTMADAFALCHRLAAIPPGCTPAVVNSNELRHVEGRPLREADLPRLGIRPYSPREAPARAASLPVQPSPATRTASVVPFAALPSPSPSRQTVLATLNPAPLPPASNLIERSQPALRIQPGVAGPAAAPRGRYWISSVYGMNDPRLVRVVAAGDTMMGSRDAGLNPAIRPGVDVASLVGGDLASIFRSADIAFLNLEGPLVDGGSSAKDCSNCFAFRSPTHYAGVLANLGIDVVSLANNHSGDFGEEGRRSTMAALSANGIAFGGLDRDGARAATLVLPGGRKAAMIAFAPNNGTLQLNDIPRAVSLVRDLKKSHDLVIVSFHGGAEGWAFVHVAKGAEKFVGENRGNVTAFSHAVIDAGADLVLGHGPHVPRAVEIYKGHLIAYSLGNFWTYSGVMNYAVSGLGPVVEAWLAPDGSLAGFSLVSTRQAGLGVPRLDPLDEAGRYVLYLTRTDFPATATRLSGARSVAGGTSASGS